MSKLRPPRLVKVLDRPRLLAHQDSSRIPRLINICAGPGFGKTTLMAQMALEFSGNSVWYQVDSLDRDPAVFLRHIISGFSHACSFEGTCARSRLGDVSDFSAESDSVLAVLLDELSEHNQTPLILCFDDYHLFDGCAYASRLVEYLIENLPEQSCVAMTTRNYPDISLGRLRSRGELLDLTDEDLQFSFDELKSLTDIWEIPVSAEAIKKVYRSTEGWPAGLVLSENVLRSGGDLPDLFSHRRIQQNVYEYLAEEVLNSQPAGMRELLIKTSLIDPIDPAVCETALNLANVGEMLAEAERRNLFTSRLDDEELYRFHPLFRDFLQSRLLNLVGKDGVADLGAGFAEVFISMGQIRQAVELYLAAGQHAKAISPIEKIGDEMLDTAEYGTLEKWLGALKEDDLTPTLQIQKARILMSAGKFRKAVRILRNAVTSVENNKETKSSSLLFIAECLINLDQYKEAINILEQLLEINLTASMRKQVLFQLCLVYWIRNNRECLNKTLKQALNNRTNDLTQQDVEIGIISSLQHLRDGNFVAADKMLNRNLESGCLSESQKNMHMNNLSSCLMMMGDYSQAIQFAKECNKRIESQREFKLIGAACDTLGCLMIVQGMEVDGIHLLTQTLDRLSSDEQFSEDLKATILCHLGSNARRRGDLDAAVGYHKKCISYASDFSSLYEKAAGQSNVGADLVRMNRFEEAEVYFKDAYKLSTRSNFSYIKTQIEFNRAWSAYMSKDDKQMLACLSLALGRARKFQQNHYLIQEGKISLSLFQAALENGIEVDYVCWIIRHFGEEALITIEPLLDNDNERLRENIIGLLVEIGTSGAITLLRRMRYDRSETIQKKVKIALTEFRSNLHKPAEILTPREAEVFELLTEGLTNHQIAQKLFIADCTVKTHVVRIYRKLGFTNRIDAIRSQQQNDKSTTFYK